MAIPAPRAGMDAWLALGDRPAQSLYFLLQGGCSSQGPLMGFPHLGEVPLNGCVLPHGGFAPRRPDISLEQVPAFHAVVCPISTQGGLSGRTLSCQPGPPSIPAPRVGTAVAS